jgi:two-component system chemotaxis response regulator CheY
MDYSNKKLGVLIVDDYKLARSTLISALTRLGLKNFTEASNGKEALEILNKRSDEGAPIDLIFSDWNMPKSSGLDLLKEIRSQEKFKDVKFVMVTVESEHSNMANAISSGADDYLIKPYVVPTIDLILRNLLKKMSYLSDDTKIGLQNSEVYLDKNFEVSLINGVTDAFQNLFDLPITQLESSQSTTEPDVITFIGMKREQIEIVLSLEFSDEILSAIIKGSLPAISDTHHISPIDIAGEVTNCICGLLKKQLSDRGMTFTMEVPMTAHHPYLMSFKNIQKNPLKLRFESQYGIFRVIAFPIFTSIAEIEIK